MESKEEILKRHVIELPKLSSETIIEIYSAMDEFADTRIAQLESELQMLQDYLMQNEKI